MTSLPAAREPAVNMNYSTEYKYALNTMGTYPSWVYWIWSALKDVGCKDTILTTGLPTDGKAHCQVLSHIADEMIMVLIDKSAFMMWAALKKQHTKRMKYKKIQMITELCTMNVGAHATLQQCLDRIGLLCASLAGIDETTFETTYRLGMGSHRHNCRGIGLIWHAVSESMSR